MKSKIPKGSYSLSIINIENESEYDRKYRMISHLATTCISCSMCSLGLVKADKYDQIRDPHILGNNNPHDVIIYSYNPTFEDLQYGEPLSSGDGLLLKTNLSSFEINNYYAGYLIRCYSTITDNTNLETCNSFIDIELKLLKPKLIVIYEKKSFDVMISDLPKYNKIYKYNGYNLIYVDPTNITLLSKLIKKLIK